MASFATCMILHLRYLATKNCSQVFEQSAEDFHFCLRAAGGSENHAQTEMHVEAADLLRAARRHHLATGCRLISG